MVHVPPSLLDMMIYFPSSGLAFLRRHVQLSNNIARKLIQSRSREVGDADKKDALSRIGICPHPLLGMRVLVSIHPVLANCSEAERWRLTDEELTPQLACVLVATVPITSTDSF